MASAKARHAASFTASFADSPRKCLQMDKDGEVTLTLLVPRSDAIAANAAVLALGDLAFCVTLTPL